MKDGQHFTEAEIETNEKDVLTFKDLHFKHLTPDHNGTYRCALKLPGSLLQLSKPVDVVLEG